MRGDVTRVYWGIEKRSTITPQWSGPLGTSWLYLGLLPSCVIRQPAGYVRRATARAKASELTTEYADLKLGWRFRAVRVQMITRAMR